MTPIQVCPASTDEFGLNADLPGYRKHGDDERLPLSLAMPMIAGLSTALWAAVWYIGRSLTGS